MSFSENFERKEDEELNYDDVAFHYFSFALLFALLVPSSLFFILKPIFFGDKVIEKQGMLNC